MENHGDIDAYIFESLIKGLHKHDGVRFEVCVHSKDQHVCRAYFRKGHQYKHIVFELPKMSHPRRTMSSESLGFKDYNGVLAMARNEHLLRIKSNKACPVPVKKVLIIFDEALSNAIFGLSHSIDIPKEFSFVEAEYKVLDQAGRSDCVVVGWNVAIACRMNRQIKEEPNVKSDEEILAEQMRKKCALADGVPSQMDVEAERVAEQLRKDLEKSRLRDEELQRRVAEAEQRANFAAAESARSQHLHQQQYENLQAQMAAKEQALKQQEEHLRAQFDNMNQQKQQQEATAQAEAERIRAEAQRLINEANRREEAANAAAAAAAKAAAANAARKTVAVNPATGEAMTEAQVHELVEEFADEKNSSYDEVMQWIAAQNLQSEQAVVDLLFAEHAAGGIQDID